MTNENAIPPTWHAMFAAIAGEVADAGNEMAHALMIDKARNQKVMVLVTTTDLATEAILSYLDALHSEGMIETTGTQYPNPGGVN